MRTIEEIKTDIENKERVISTFKTEIENFDKEANFDEGNYDDALDCEGMVNVAGMQFFPSRIIKELDPTAYNCGMSDYIDSMELDEFEEYNELTKQLEEYEDELTILEEELEELEDIESENEEE